MPTFAKAGRYNELLLSTAGTLLASTAVTVRLPGTATAATLYTDRNKGTAAANPVSSDSYGNLAFYADPGLYDLFVNGVTLGNVLVPVDYETPAPNGTYVVSDAGLATADDTSRLQALLTAKRTAGGGYLKCLPGQVYKISSPLVIGSNTTFDITGATLQLIAGSHSKAIRNYADTAVATATDAAITAGSNVVTSALGASAVVGQSCIVLAAGGAGASPLVGIVSAKTATTITLVTLAGRPANATTTVASGGSVSLYTRDTNIRIIGGTHDRGSNDGTNLNKNHIVITHADDVVVELEKYTAATTGVGKWAIRFADCRRFHGSIDNFVGGAAAVLVSGPAYLGRVERVRGASSYDDFVAFQAADWPGYIDTAGDIIDCGWGDVACSSAGANLVKIIAGAGCLVDGISGGTIHGTAAYYGLWVGDDGGQATTTGGTYGTIDSGLVAAYPGAPDRPMVYIACPAARRIDLNVKWNPSTNNQPAVEVTGISSTVTIRELRIRGQVGANGGAVVKVTGANTTIDHLILDDLYHDSQGATTRSTVVVESGTIDELVFGPGVVATYPDTAYAVYQTASTGWINRLKFIGGQYSGAAAMWRNTVGCPAIEITLDDCTVASMTNVLVHAAGVTATVYEGLGVTYTSISGTRFSVSGSAVFDIRSRIPRIVLPAPVFSVVVGGGTPSLSGDATSSDLVWWALDAAANEHVGTTALIPEDWQTYDVYLWWSNAGAGAGDVRWHVLAGGLVDASSIATTDGIFVTTAPALNVLKRTVTRVGLTAPASRLAAFRVFRQASDASDTLANDAGFIGLELRKAS